MRHRTLAATLLLAAAACAACRDGVTSPSSWTPLVVSITYPRLPGAGAPPPFAVEAAGDSVVATYTRPMGCGTQLTGAGTYGGGVLELTVIETSVPYNGACLAALVSTTVRLTARPAPRGRGRYTVAVRELLPRPNSSAYQREVGRATVVLP